MPKLTPITAAPSHADHAWPAPLKAPLEWFTPPQHMVETAKRGVATHTAFAPNGRVYGHVASFEIPITLPTGQQWYLPRDLDLEETMRGHYETEEGQAITSGLLMTDRSHTDRSLPLDVAKDKFGNVGNQLAIVRFGYDNVGLWHAGVVAPGAQAKSIVAARAGDVSGEWFPVVINGQFTGEMEFLGSQVVNIGGFKLRQGANRGLLTGIAAAFQGTIVASMLPPRYPVRMAPRPQGVTAVIIPAGSVITTPQGETIPVPQDCEIADDMLAAPAAGDPTAMVAAIVAGVTAAVEAAFQKMKPADEEDPAKKKPVMADATGGDPAAAGAPVDAPVDSMSVLADSLLSLHEKVDKVIGTAAQAAIDPLLAEMDDLVAV